MARMFRKWGVRIAVVAVGTAVGLVIMRRVQKKHPDWVLL